MKGGARGHLLINFGWVRFALAQHFTISLDPTGSDETSLLDQAMEVQSPGHLPIGAIRRNLVHSFAGSNNFTCPLRH